MNEPIRTYDASVGLWGSIIDADLQAIRNDLDSIRLDVEIESSNKDFQRLLRQHVFDVRKRVKEILATHLKDIKGSYFSLSLLSNELNRFGRSEADFDELKDKEFFYETNKLLADGISKTAEKLSAEEQSELRLLAENFGYLEDADNLFFYAKAKPITTAMKTHATLLNQQIARLRPPLDIRLFIVFFLIFTGAGIMAALVESDGSWFERIASSTFLTGVFIALIVAKKSVARKISSWAPENSVQRELLIKQRALLENKLNEIDMKRFEDLDNWYKESNQPLEERLAMLRQLISIGHKYQIVDRTSFDSYLNEAIEWSKLSAEEALQRIPEECPELAEILSVPSVSSPKTG